MKFIETYKQLEKLCGEVMNDDRRVSAYIEEMMRLTDGAYRVENWNEDLKKLKHYRWVRNKIVHEPDCTEANMCKAEDVVWLNQFRRRILNGTDPLALYRKSERLRAWRPEKKKKSSRFGCVKFLILLVLLGVIVFLWKYDFFVEILSNNVLK